MNSVRKPIGRLHFPSPHFNSKLAKRISRFLRPLHKSQCDKSSDQVAVSKVVLRLFDDVQLSSLMQEELARIFYEDIYKADNPNHTPDFQKMRVAHIFICFEPSGSGSLCRLQIAYIGPFPEGDYDCMPAVTTSRKLYEKDLEAYNEQLKEEDFASVLVQCMYKRAAVAIILVPISRSAINDMKRNQCLAQNDMMIGFCRESKYRCTLP